MHMHGRMRGYVHVQACICTLYLLQVESKRRTRRPQLPCKCAMTQQRHFTHVHAAMHAECLPTVNVRHLRHV